MLFKNKQEFKSQKDHLHPKKSKISLNSLFWVTWILYFQYTLNWK
jgi:hypothetical protein